jgi:hypothetical protein
MLHKLIDSAQIEHLPPLQHEVVVVMPFISSKQAMSSAELLAARANYPFDLICIFDEHREGFVSIINRAFKHFKSPYFAYVAEDAFAGRDWLKMAMQSMKALDGGLLAFNDGKWHGQLAAFGLVARDWAIDNYAGDLFYADYQSHYADVEISLIAKTQNRLIYQPDAVLMEIDYEKDNKSTNENDKRLFNQRKNSKFNQLVLDNSILNTFQ